MPRALLFVTVLLAASLLGNVWLYRELEVREHASAPAIATSPHQSPGPILNATSLAAPLAAVAFVGPVKTTYKEMIEKCSKKFEQQARDQFRDPKQRELLKSAQIHLLQAMNLGAQESLHLTDTVFNRILEIQAEQDLTAREASIGHARQAKAVGVNEQIAAEFGDTVASQWANYMREGYGRLAVRGVANLFADANLAISDEQRRRLVTVYSEEFENQQDGPWGASGMGSGNEQPTVARDWLEKQEERRTAYEQRIQTAAASFLTPTQMELLRKKSELESEQMHSVLESMPKVSAVAKGAEVDDSIIVGGDC